MNQQQYCATEALIQLGDEAHTKNCSLFDGQADQNAALSLSLEQIANISYASQRFQNLIPPVDG